MQRNLLSVLIASLFAAAPVAAQTTAAGSGTSSLPARWVTQGEITLGPIFTDIDSQDASKAEQYRDLSDGVLSSILARGRGPTGYWIDFYGENFGRDDMYINLEGGRYDAFKYRVYTDWLTHNRLFNGRTPFAGSGSGDLRATFPQPDPSTWNSLNIGFDRRDTGGYFEWQRNSPWYFRVDTNYVERDGTKIGSAANGTSPGNGFVDLAIPVDYKTVNASAEFGYSSPQYHFAVNYLFSKMDSGFKTVTWSNPFWANGIDTTHLAPDNDYQRLAVNGTMRQLPWSSTLSARLTWDRLESDTTLATSALNGANVFGATNPNVANFNGKVENTTFSAAWSAMPTRGVDTRLFYNYWKRDNDSTHVEYQPVSGLACGTVVVGGVSQPGPCDNELYSYEKWNVGFDAYWRFARGQRLGGGIEYLHQDRHRPDYDETKDTKLFIEYKNTMVDGLAARIKYTYLDRDSHFLLGNEGANANDVLFMERFIGRFDAQPVERNEVKVVVDWTPSPLFDLSVEAIWKDNDYKRSGSSIDYQSPSPVDEFLGRTKDERKEIYVSASFGDPSKLRATAFFDIEWIEYDSFHRNVNAGSCPTTSGGVTATNCFDPNTPPNSIAYNWSAVNKDKNWSAGIGVDWPALPNLMLKTSYLYVRTDGKADIATQNNFGNPLPITAYDDTKTQSFNLKAIWDINRRWQLTAGYAYEKYEYSDDQYDGYQYTIPFPGVTNNTSQSYLNGFNAFTPYKANIFYLLGTYRF
jgi:MtrB/PioB family decaheme-associated outer membrane protein